MIMKENKEKDKREEVYKRKYFFIWIYFGED